MPSSEPHGRQVSLRKPKRAPSWINVKNHDIRIWFVTHNFQMRRIADRFGKPLRMHVVFVQPLYVML